MVAKNGQGWPKLAKIGQGGHGLSMTKMQEHAQTMMKLLAYPTIVSLILSTEIVFTLLWSSTRAVVSVASFTIPTYPACKHTISSCSLFSTSNQNQIWLEFSSFHQSACCCIVVKKEDVQLIAHVRGKNIKYESPNRNWIWPLQSSVSMLYNGVPENSMMN